MADEAQAAGAQKKIKVVVAEGAQTGIYSNAVSVNVTPNEVIVDFGYLMPGAQEPTVKVVNRVNLSHRTAESFMKVFQNAMLDFMNKSKQPPVA
ncbi:MAG: DUF3467 domain-containing protein [Patescibacteria group bacterium]|nr:DUF3467 domain-containing protein [Patescibacteria group bacterium]